MKQQLRVVAEVTGIAIVAPFVGTLLTAALSLPLCSLDGPSAVRIVGSLVPAIGVFLLVACPCLGGFVYGRDRRLQLRFAPVFVGWVAGDFLYGRLSHFAMDMIDPVHKSTKTGSAPWWGWLLWAAWLGAFTLLPTLATMWGQRMRLAAAPPATEVAAE